LFTNFGITQHRLLFWERRRWLGAELWATTHALLRRIEDEARSYPGQVIRGRTASAAAQSGTSRTSGDRHDHHYDDNDISAQQHNVVVSLEDVLSLTTRTYASF